MVLDHAVDDLEVVDGDLPQHRRVREGWRLASRAAARTAAPAVYVTTLPPLIGDGGAPAVSSATTSTESWRSPNASAAMSAKVVATPVMSTTPVETVGVPSLLGGMVAPAPCPRPGPGDSPTPSFGGSRSRACQSGWRATASRHSAAPMTGHGSSSTISSPSATRFRRRSSSGSTPSSAASSSSSVSMAMNACGPPGPR